MTLPNDPAYDLPGTCSTSSPLPLSNHEIVSFGHAVYQFSQSYSHRTTTVLGDVSIPVYEIALLTLLGFKDRLPVSQPEEFEFSLSTVLIVESLLDHGRVERLAHDFVAVSAGGMKLTRPFIVHLLAQDPSDPRGQRDLNEGARKGGNRVLIVDRERALELRFE